MSSGEQTRVQLRRTPGWRMPADAVKVDRSTEWGNEFKIVGPIHGMKGPGKTEWWVESSTSTWRFPDKESAQTGAVSLHREWIMAPAQAVYRDRVRLRFKRRRPACWCDPSAPCHGDTLAEIASTPLECEAA